MFNSYILNKFLINPSYAGISGNTNIYGLNRIHFVGFDGAPVTYMIAGDASIKNKKIGLGGVMFSDRNHIIAQTGLQFAYSYGLKLNDQWKLGLGLNVGMVQWALNFDRLRVEDYSESILSTAPSNATTFRSDFGLNLSSDKIEFGLALPQIVSSKVKYSDYTNNSKGNYSSIPHYLVNLGYWIDIKEDIKVKPMAVVRGAKNVKTQFDVIGLLDWKNKAYASLGYRSNFAFSIGGGVNLPMGLKVGYNYDRPLNAISTFSAGGHEFVVGITLGGSSKSAVSEKANGLNKEAEDKLKADLEKQISSKLSIEFENKLNMEIDSKVKKIVDDKIAKALQDKSVPSSSGDGNKTPSTGASLSKEDIDKLKKDIEDLVKKQMNEGISALIDDKVKKAMEGKPGSGSTTPTVSKEETEKLRKESEARIKKELEENLKKELAEKVNKVVEERLAIEAQKAKEAALKTPPEYKMTPKDKAMLDSLKQRDLDNEKRIAELEKQLKAFPEYARVENVELINIRMAAKQNDIDLKKFKTEQKALFDAAPDAPKKSKKTEADESGEYVIILAAFKTLKDAQGFQKIASQTFEFPDTKVLKPAEMDGWFFVYQKSYADKKEAQRVYFKLLETDTNTPKYPWIYLLK